MSDAFEKFKNHTPKDNDDKAAFIGDFIVNLKPIRQIISKKTELPWIILEGEVIRVVSQKEGNQAQVGDQWSKLYSGAEEEGLIQLDNDCHTIGIVLDKSSKEAFELSFANAENKKAYIRAWQYERKDKTGMNQSFAIKSKKLITPELEQAEIPF